MFFITQETHALHYTENACKTSHRKQMHYITQETLNYITHKTYAQL